MRSLISIVGLTLLVGCSNGGGEQALSVGSPPSADAIKVHSAIMERLKSYGSLQDPKVLTGCFSEAPGASPPVRVRRVFAWHTSQASDIPVFAGKLRREAVKTCEGWAASENVDCDCKLIDVSGKNVLDL